MKLLLGCGNEQRVGWVHLDRRALRHVDVVHDLDVAPWPFEDASAGRIEAIDVLEHLEDPVAFFDECWRILRPGGTLLVQAVRYTSENCWRDPTHKRGFHPDTFRYFDPEEEWGRRYAHLYTDRPWKVLRIEDGDNVRAEMTPRKGEY